MAMDTFIVLAASYDTLGAAEADYHAVRDFYLTSVSRLDDLGRLREKGVISQAEFETAKSRLLGG